MISGQPIRKLVHYIEDFLVPGPQSGAQGFQKVLIRYGCFVVHQAFGKESAFVK